MQKQACLIIKFYDSLDRRGRDWETSNSFDRTNQTEATRGNSLLFFFDWTLGFLSPGRRRTKQFLIFDWFVFQTSLIWGPSFRARCTHGITAILCRTLFWVSEHNTCARFCLKASQRFHCTVCVWQNTYVDSEGCVCARTPTHIKKAVMNSLFFPVSDETRKILSHFVPPPHKCECRDSASGWIHKMPGTLPCLFLSLRLWQAEGILCVCVCVCVCVHYQGNPSPLSTECFSKVYSTARQAGRWKDSILLPVLTHGKSAALPRALVSVLLLSRATDRGHKMDLEGTQHRALTFLIACLEAAVTRMKKRKSVFLKICAIVTAYFSQNKVNLYK